MPTAPFDLRPQEAKMAAFSDVALIKKVYDLVGEVESSRLQDEFYWYLTEAFERFAPEAEWAHVEHQYEDDDNREAELRDARESFERRRDLREQMRRNFQLEEAS